MGGDQRWPVYARPYRNRGLLAGTLTFGAGAASAIDQIDGTLSWQKPVSAGPAYRAGFNGSIVVEGGRYAPPARGAAALDIENWKLVLGANVLTDPVKAVVTLNQRNRFTLTGAGATGTSLKLDPATGLLTGRCIPTGVGPVAFKGVLLLGQRVGRGLVSLPDRSGPVTLDPPQTP
jgi:hypothetical protein